MVYEIASKFTAIIIIHNASEYIHTPTVGDNVAILICNAALYMDLANIISTKVL